MEMKRKTNEFKLNSKNERFENLFMNHLEISSIQNYVYLNDSLRDSPSSYYSIMESYLDRIPILVALGKNTIFHPNKR